MTETTSDPPEGGQGEPDEQDEQQSEQDGDRNGGEQEGDEQPIRSEDAEKLSDLERAPEPPEGPDDTPGP